MMRNHSTRKFREYQAGQIPKKLYLYIIFKLRKSKIKQNLERKWKVKTPYLERNKHNNDMQFLFRNHVSKKRL